MKRAIPLMLLALAACDAPLEQQFEPYYLSFEREEGKLWDVRLQKDPFEGWTARISSPSGRLAEDQRDEVMAFFTDEIGPLICTDDQKIVVEDEDVWHRQTRTVTYLKQLGQWNVIGNCTGAVEHL